MTEAIGEQAFGDFGGLKIKCLHQHVNTQIHLLALRRGACFVAIGPDETGVEVIGNDAVFAHKRLSIIDVAFSHEPLPYANGRYLLTFNGEIYNYIELRKEFPGANFQTSSDCELPLWLYDRDKAAFAKSMRGMYALALYDPAEATLFLSRDPFGIKPLYYTQTGNAFAFASEPRALVLAGFAKAGVRQPVQLPPGYLHGRGCGHVGSLPAPAAGDNPRNVGCPAAEARFLG